MVVDCTSFIRRHIKLLIIKCTCLISSCSLTYNFWSHDIDCTSFTRHHTFLIIKCTGLISSCSVKYNFQSHDILLHEIHSTSSIVACSVSNILHIKSAACQNPKMPSAHREDRSVCADVSAQADLSCRPLGGYFETDPTAKPLLEIWAADYHWLAVYLRGDFWTTENFVSQRATDVVGLFTILKHINSCQMNINKPSIEIA